ncbi:MAG: cobalt transporter CbiM [Desulfovibrio sp.]
MHISEGVLNTPVLVSGFVLSAMGVGYGLKRIQNEQLPQVALLSAAFFVASLIHVPIGPSSAHLVLNGLVGLILGWAAFPAIFVALLLQSLLFQFGGLTILGVNTFAMAAPAVLCGILAKGYLVDTAKGSVAAFAAGFGSIALSCLLVGAALVTAGDQFLPAVQTLVAANFPIMIIEGIITASAVGFLKKVKPELLNLTPQFSQQ